MKKGRNRCTMLLSLVAGGAVSVAQAQSITTGLQNNGTGGIFIDLTPTSAPLVFNSFATYWTGTSTIEVWTRPGSYVGFDASSAGWTQSQVITGVTGAGANTLATVNLTTPIQLPAGQTTAIYLQPTSGGAFQYTTGDATHPTTYSNADITLFSDVARTGLVVFGGTRNSPRVFAGTIFYSPGDPATPGACCRQDGSCSNGTLGDCQTAGGVFQGVNSQCSGVTCPQPGACCKNDGTCSNGLPATCAAQGGSFQAGACASVNCNGACCNPDGTCTSASSNACTSGGGIFNGFGTLCSGVTCAPFHGEIEPNETRPTATPVTFGGPGEVIKGTTTGTVSTAGLNSLDQFLVKTPAMATGIWRNRLVITTSGTAGHVGSIRALNQVAAALGPWPGPVGTAGTTDSTMQTSIATSTPPRMNQWYGFGKQEQIYYRITGATTTTADYASVWSVDPVTPTTIGPFPVGELKIDFSAQGHTTDSEIWIYDSNLNAIDGYGNDDRSTVSSMGAATSSLQGLFKRTFAAGTYYAAVSNYQMSNDKGSPCDDNSRGGFMMDFPNSMVNGSATTGLNISFAVTDSAAATTTVAVTRPGVFDVMWFKFTVGSAGPACYANCDSSTALPFLNVQDFSCFLQKFSAQDQYANCDGSTQAPVLNVQDFSCFLQKFSAGCSAP